MKKLFIPILIFNGLAVALSSCKKNHPDHQGNSPVQTTTPCQISIAEYINNSNTGSLVFNYNNQAQLISFSSEGVSLNYIYTSNQIRISYQGNNNYYIDLSDGKATKISTGNGNLYYNLTYTTDGYLSAVKEYDENKLTTITSFTYSGGNLASSTQTYPDDPLVTKVTTFQHSSDTDNLGLLFGELQNSFIGGLYIPYQCLGKRSVNVLKSSDYTYTKGDFLGKELDTYTFTKGTDGRINAATYSYVSTSMINGKQTSNEQGNQTFKVDSSCK